MAVTRGDARPPAPDELASYDGLCTMCGWKGVFTGTLASARDGFACGGCEACLRHRDMAAALLCLLGRGRHHFLSRWARDPEMARLRILDVATRSPFASPLRHLPGYLGVEPVAGAPAGTVRIGDWVGPLTSLGMAEASLDLVLTGDILDLLPDPEAAIAAFARVLRPGGAHVASVAVRWPLPAASTVDGTPDQTALRRRRSGWGAATPVVSTFGADIVALHARWGLRAWWDRPHQSVAGLHRLGTLVSLRVAC
jgi:SAM-dependent methyltransferase